MPQDTPTAKDFKEPLLKVLATSSGNKANRPVDYSLTYDPVCKLMGITVDQYGKQEGTNTNMVERWIQWAFNEMSKQGSDLTVRLARGEWALTDKGLSEAQRLLSESVAIPVVAPEPPLKPQGVSLAVGPGNDVSDAYHHDPYIRSLATAETKCFGAFSDQSSICERCPLQGACLNAMAAELSALARMLAVEDLRGTQKPDPAAAPPTPPPPRPTVNDAFTGTNVVGSQIVTVQQQAKCGHCNGVIPKNAEAHWVRSGNKSGLFHMTCYDPKKAT